MSGWLAIFRTDGAPIDREEIERGMRELRTRGPHGEAVLVDGSAALGLTVLDPRERVPAARAPVRHGRLVVTGHVRLDAREDLARSLGVPAVELAALSDLALFARAFERFGEDTPARAFGEYAVAVWDAEARRLTVARDAFGVRPAFVAHVAGVAIASNTLDAVRAHPAISERLDEEAILEFLLTDWVVGLGRTPFHDVKLAPAGGTWSVSPAGVRSRVAWTLQPPPVDRKTPWQEQGRRWLHALDVAVADRVRGGPVSILLSGGVDSTAIAASAALLGAEQLYGATDVYGRVLEGRDDEGDFAALAARHLGIRHDLFTITDPPAAQPFAWQPQLTPTPSVERFDVEDNGSLAALASHSAIALHGEGGDEIWRTTEMTQLLGVEPWGALARGVVETLAHGHRPALGLNVRGRLRGTRKRPRPPEWLSPEIRRRHDVEAILRRALLRIGPKTRGPRAGSLKGLGTALWQEASGSYDATAAAQGLELRLPLVDPRVIMAALTLPPLPGVIHKLAARRALVGRLPAALIDRKKTPAADIDDCRNVRPPWELLPVAPALDYYVDVARLQGVAAAQGTTWEVLRAVSLWRWLGGGMRRPGERSNR